MSALSGIDIALWDLKGDIPNKLETVCRKRLLIIVHSPAAQCTYLRTPRRPGSQPLPSILLDRWRPPRRHRSSSVSPSNIEARMMLTCTYSKARKAQGFTCVKMNATEDINWLDIPSALDSTIDRLKTVKALGLNAGLDFHGRLHKPMAKQLAKALEPHRPLFIEEPLLMEHPEALKQLAGMTSIPIALGERLYTRWDVKGLLESGVVDVLQPDVAHAGKCCFLLWGGGWIRLIVMVGGISETKRIATMAEAYDVAIAPHCPLGPIAFAACLHIGLSTPNFVIQEMSIGMHYNTEAGDIDLNTYLKDRSVFEIKDGHVAAPTGPGLGIDIDEEMVRKISAETEPWQCKEFYGPDGSIREW